MSGAGGGMEDMDETQWAPLVDVGNERLVDPLASEDTALARAVERLVRDVSDPNGVIAAFGSFVET